MLWFYCKFYLASAMFVACRRRFFRIASYPPCFLTLLSCWFCRKFKEIKNNKSLALNKRKKRLEIIIYTNTKILTVRTSHNFRRLSYVFDLAPTTKTKPYKSKKKNIKEDGFMTAKEYNVTQILFSACKFFNICFGVCIFFS